MSRLAFAFALSFASIGTALACDGPNCDKSHCPMSAAPGAESAALPADGAHVKLEVTGMHCGACADKVKTALLGVQGVKGATVDATTGKAEVAYDDKATSTDKLLAAVAATGSFSATVATN